MTSDEVLSNIITLGSKIALLKDTLEDMLIIIKANKYSSDIIAKLGNRELKTKLYDHFGIAPSDPTEYLRYVINKLTNESLIIKNKNLIEKIKLSDVKLLDSFVNKAPDNLGTIFFRYKPLFLAMKKVSKNKNFFNQLRKKANTQHIPLKTDYMNDVTSQIKHGKLKTDELSNRLKDAGIFRKIRLAYALNYRLQNSDSIVYKVRNGRGWVTDFEWIDNSKITNNVLENVLSSIAENISKNVLDKTIFLPEGIKYALPATEKQFMGNIPSNSYVVIPDDIVVGIHWTDTDQGRIDLDFSMIDTAKYGWDSRYRNDERSVMFSGDNTSAPKPNGASELYYVKRGFAEPKILMVNYYNYDSGDPVNCKVFVAHEEPERLDQNYVVDVNNIIATANVLLDQKQTMLGLLTFVNGENRLYFSSTSIGSSITSRDDDMTEKSRKYLINSSLHPIDFKSILLKAGANVVDKRPEKEYIDLSPESLDKNTFINLLQ